MKQELYHLKYNTMLIELRKETSIDKDTFKEKIWYWVYIDGNDHTCHFTEEIARNYIATLKEYYSKHGKIPPTVETLLSEEINPPS